MEEKTQEVTTQEISRNFDLTSFTRAKEKMVSTNQTADSVSTLGGYYSWSVRYRKTYTPEEIRDIVEEGSIQAKRILSNYFFETNGYYRQIILSYVNLLKYSGILIPNPTNGKKLSNSNISKRYYGAINYEEMMKLPSFYANCIKDILVNGVYYGLIISKDKSSFVCVDLPYEYCRTRYQDPFGNDLVEFNVQYFDTITCPEDRELTLKLYPKVVVKAYRDKKRVNPWVVLPMGTGVCFLLFDGTPIFLPMLLDILDYEDAMDDQKARDKEEISKIIVQKVPHLTDGQFLLEPDEVAELHAGAVGMLKGNPHLSVLSTYADVDAIVSKTTNDNKAAILERYEKNIYVQGAVSPQLFASTSSSTLDASQRVMLGFMMLIARKIDNFVSYFIDNFFGNGNVTFKYETLPVAYFNEDKFITNSYKLASSGYSFLLPALAMGISQRDLSSIKDLENNILQLSDIMIPLQSSYVQGNGSGSNSSEKGEVGRPALEEEEKSEKTIANEESIDNQAGGNQ